ncbi:MAG TPA: hypothetical protein VD997_12515 [Phycisphaerales bacterium]|nr:hypothetical protein [Phycisphaerales bacterium]
MAYFRSTSLAPLSVVIACALSASARADLVRWINPAGGSFGEGSNWEGGHPPLASDTAVFDLPATYTVTVDANRTIADLIVGAGAVALELSETELTTQTITCTLGTVRVNNGVVHGRANANGGVIHVLASAEFDRGGTAGNGGQLLLAGTLGKQGDGAGFVSVGAGSTLVVASTGAISSRSVTVNGTLRVEAGLITAELLMVGGSFVMDGGRVQGELGPLLLPGSQTHFFNGAVIVPGTGTDAQGSLLIEGEGTTAAVARVTGVMRLGGGGEAHPISPEMSVAEQGRVEVGAGGMLSGRFYRMDQGVLRLEQGSVGPTGGFESFGLYTNTALELVIDAAASPRFVERWFRAAASAFECELAGSLTIEVLNGNALRAGDTITLLTASSPVISGGFSSLSAPQLPGGRALQTSVTPTAVVLEVVAGGANPCWTADFNGDGNVGTDQDIETFFACIGGHCCATCGDADFNADGDTATDQDIEAFFRVLGGAAC